MVKCSTQVRQLKTALRWKIPAAQRQRIQMVLLRECGMAQPAIAAAMGVSLSTVNRAHMAYDHGTHDAEPEQRRSRRTRSKPMPAAAAGHSGEEDQWAGWEAWLRSHLDNEREHTEARIRAVSCI
jgi:hypothetical protein